MYQSLKRHIQGVQLILSISVAQRNESPVLKFNLVCSVYCVRGQLYDPASLIEKPRWGSWLVRTGAEKLIPTGNRSPDLTVSSDLLHRNAV